MNGVEYRKGAARPAMECWLKDDDGALIDFSTGSPTFSLKIGRIGEIALLTKTTGIAGAAGAGEEPTGTPNVVVTWVAGDLNITPGPYLAQLTVTVSSLPRLFAWPFTITDVIT